MRFLFAVLFLALAFPAYAVDMPPDEGGDDVIETPAKEAPKAAAGAKGAPAPTADTTPKQELNTVILQGLNKVTGHMSKFNAIVGKPVDFGTLEIIAHRCWKSSPEERPENSALLEIREEKDRQDPTTLFIGWMFSSSPGLSALEHPVYDVTVLSCADTPGADKKPSGQQPK